MKHLRDRFESKFQYSPGCWLWTGAMSGTGYGHIKVDGAPKIASRVSYELYVGKIPDGMHVLHRCDTPACVNPDHLFLGTHLDNMRDMYAKGRRKAATGLRNGAAKLSLDMVKTILGDMRPSEVLGPILGVSGSRVRQIRREMRQAI